MKALVVAGGISQAALIQELKSRGIYTILADRNPNAVAVPYADAFYPVSTLDEEGIYQLALKEKVDCVLTACADQVEKISLAYKQFRSDMIERALFLKGIEIIPKTMALTNGYEEPFWHIISRKNPLFRGDF